jgi:hypothetical protein
MGFLMAAARARSGDELANALGQVRVLGGIRKSGPWWWTVVFYLHFKELHEALSVYETDSLSAYAGNGAWKFTLYGPNQSPFSLWFDVSLVTQGGIEKAKVYYEGKNLKLARQFGLSREDQTQLDALTFEDAVARVLDLQLEAILAAFQRFSIAHDPVAIRETLFKPTSDELDSELGNLPRFLEGIGLTGLLED